ncbi:hypothetical protein MSTE_02621 [Mycobacteroides stephanolepidis]|uniref:DUF1345 domain-containing protein n=2 Tax=[Mycobacterium] stephanolepidis TaxID=1520670 RepID=A0A1Z4EY98_9MYCO|nr:hypothetical protein MSTE_02621 [[Mycobacterium] stephanolepidis]
MERLAHEVTDDVLAAEKYLPSWLRPGAPESRIPVLIALVAAIGLQLAIPAQFNLTPRWPLPALESALLVVLVILNPLKFTRSTTLGRWATYVLIAAITADNTISAALLDYKIVTGQMGDNPRVLLGSGLAIFITNIIVFGMWYWEFDRGGPFARHTTERPHPDFMFPQMANPELAPPDWRPKFPDYLYVSFTNVVAFSPTDTMPLSRWAKMLMTLQSMVALSTVALVLARAVNILG